MKKEIKEIKENESNVRSMVSESAGSDYKALKDLEEAKKFEDAFLIMEGDYGGQIFLSIPVKYIKCDFSKLEKLIQELNKIAWPDNDAEGTKIVFERKKIGENINGGMGGGSTIEGLWVHKDFEFIKPKIQDVIDNKRGTVRNYLFDALELEYEARKKMFDEGKEKDKLGLMFLGYALDVVDYVCNNYQVELDFSEQSIEDVEKILDHLNKTKDKAKPSEEKILMYAKGFAGYIGQVIITRWGGEWIDESAYSIQNGPALKVKGSSLFLLSKVYRRICDGPEDNVWIFYKMLKNEWEGGKLKEINIEDLKVSQKKSWFKRIFQK